ncbi:asparagine synthase (glutamine-hydrolyzing) [Micromonospora sp. NPDC051296]|uniref:asparagine synthase (glutamine-hydrolyzing) n=1 Tax=Micromonospora sp. NPDC051296 TaxID=3155046 RepID=UPI0034450A8F
MCGIVAAVAATGHLPPDGIDPAVRTLTHRGPDGSGTWRSPDGRALLGHTRLAVIDLDGGRQPMHTTDGAYHLVANAEFYGYQAIRRDLRRRGHLLASRSDSEIALHLYAERGAAALPLLRGEFAFAIWDQPRGELFAARDRFGIKPLYYTRHAGRIYLASEIKALLALGVPARWDSAALAEHLVVCQPADRTLFADIRQVPPGCWLRTDGRDVRLGSYWDLDLPAVAELPSGGDRGRHLAALREAVMDAVQVRMRADVPVAYHLSGGMDSGTIVAVAARSRPPATFTVRFDGDAFDEGEQARRSAIRAGAVHTEIPISGSEFAGHVEAVVAHGEMIQENSHGIARLRQAELIRAHGYRVVLAGEGGDEMFAGYPQSRVDLARTRGGGAGFAADRDRLTAAGAEHLTGIVDRLGFLPAWILDRYLSVGAAVRPLLRPAFAAQFATARPCGDLIDAAHDQLRGRSAFHQSSYLFAKTWLCNYLLAAERLDMAHALEVRLPFLDHQLLAVVKWTPLPWYAEGGGSKPLLRDAMGDLLAPELAAGTKRGFQAPPAVTDDATLRRLRQIVAEDTVETLPFFAPERVRALVARLADLPPARRVGYERVVQLVTGVLLMTTTFGMRS